MVYGAGIGFWENTDRKAGPQKISKRAGSRMLSYPTDLQGLGTLLPVESQGLPITSRLARFQANRPGMMERGIMSASTVVASFLLDPSAYDAARGTPWASSPPRVHCDEKYPSARIAINFFGELCEPDACGDSLILIPVQFCRNAHIAP